MRQVTLELAVYHVEVAETHDPDEAAEYGCRLCAKYLEDQKDAVDHDCESGFVGRHAPKMSAMRHAMHLIMELASLEGGEFRADRLHGFGEVVVGAALHRLVAMGELVQTPVRLTSWKPESHRRRVWLFVTPEKARRDGHGTQA